MLAAALAGCASSQEGVSSVPPAAPAAVESRAWQIEKVTVRVPGSLSVSRNPDDRFPDTDIVWWGDPAEAQGGSRYAQVAVLVAESARDAATSFHGPRAVELELEVKRFHAVTPASRELGAWGTHDIHLTAVVRDQLTRAELARDDDLTLSFPALQRGEAKAADARGETQRVRVEARLTDFLRDWLTGR